MIQLSTPLGSANHARMIDDLLSMVEIFRKGQAPAPLALLADLGGEILYAKRNDLGGWRVRRDGALHQLLASLSYRAAFGKTLRVSWLHLALALGRKDLHRDFVRAGRIETEVALKWLVLYGIDEHRLWRFLNRRFVADLKRRSIATEHGAVSPLDLILLDERADLRGPEPLGGPAFARKLDGWIERNGVHEYKLFWTIDDAGFQRMAAKGGAELRGSGEDFAATLATAHENGGVDLFVAPTAEVAKRLEGVSRLSPAEREAALQPPIDYTVAGDDAETAALRPTPLTGELISAFDFLPGDNGHEATASGMFGRPTADGVPLASSQATFFFSAPKCARIVVLIDIRFGDAAARLLVRIDGRTAGVFSAAGLARRTAKVYAELEMNAVGNERLTVELECLPAGSPPAPGPLAWLRSLCVLRAPEFYA